MRQREIASKYLMCLCEWKAEQNQKRGVVKSQKKKKVVESHDCSCPEGTQHREEEEYSAIFIYSNCI